MRCNINNNRYCIWYTYVHCAWQHFGKNDVFNLGIHSTAFAYQNGFVDFMYYLFRTPVTYWSQKRSEIGIFDGQPSQYWELSFSLSLSLKSPIFGMQNKPNVGQTKHIKSWTHPETTTKNNRCEKSVTLIIIFCFKCVYMIQTKTTTKTSTVTHNYYYYYYTTFCAPSGTKYIHIQYTAANIQQQ